MPPAPPHAAELEALFATAQQLHQAGRLVEAGAQYERVVALDAGHHRALAQLGTLHLQLGNHAVAARLLGRSLELAPQQAAALHNRGVALQALGQPEAAAVCFAQLAQALQAQGRASDAVEQYTRALALRPDYAEAHYNLGGVLLSLGRLDEAVAAYSQALALLPGNVDILNNRANALRQLRRLDEALADYDQAIAQAPERAALHYNRAIALKEAKQREAALAAIERARALAPGQADAHNEHGIVLQSLNRYADALAAHDRAIALDSTQAASHYQRGVALHHLGRYDDALAAHDQAIALSPDNPYGYWNKALLLLLLGRYAEGWPLYEWRWRRAEMAGKQRQCDAPLWLGERDITGQTLMIHAEQGLGDTLQYCRYAPQLVARGAHVVLEVQPVLAGLLRSLGADITIVAQGEPLPHVDYHCPVMSLPLACSTTLDTIPAPPAYLFAAPARQAAWAERLGPARRRRIGLVWSGNAIQSNDHNRSLALADLAPLLSMDVEWHALQKDIRPADLATLASLPQLQNWQAQLSDFDETAALVMQMDLVISVCTSVAHLAAALGKPTWVLLPHMADQRWLLERDDSPWYPSVRLFRQPAHGDWPAVIAAVQGALHEHVPSA